MRSKTKSQVFIGYRRVSILFAEKVLRACDVYFAAMILVWSNLETPGPHLRLPGFYNNQATRRRPVFDAKSLPLLLTNIPSCGQSYLQDIRDSLCVLPNRTSLLRNKSWHFTISECGGKSRLK